ncbi:MAG: heme-binding protein [Candidatus Thiodiazotropha sp. (ex. Lucinisca nassula)]|nr:heme-binding protein [Candidatus Thiodiazotropha sp. (ex. Lucinisca nassula)]
MKYLVRIAAMVLLTAIGAKQVMAIEEAQYDVVQKESDFEIRDYAPHILAETFVTGAMEDAGKAAFGHLFDYISGNNQSRKEVTMTAPVGQQPAGEKIKMTAPVGQQPDSEGWVVSFMMPSEFTIETLPIPNDSKVTLREVPPQRMAAIRYSGFWSESSYLEHKAELVQWINEAGLTITGEPVWARYNAPFTPWFMRRNEILIPVRGAAKTAAVSHRLDAP